MQSFDKHGKDNNIRNMTIVVIYGFFPMSLGAFARSGYDHESTCCWTTSMRVPHRESRPILDSKWVRLFRSFQINIFTRCFSLFFTSKPVLSKGQVLRLLLRGLVKWKKPMMDIIRQSGLPVLSPAAACSRDPFAQMGKNIRSKTDLKSSLPCHTI